MADPQKQRKSVKRRFLLWAAAVILLTVLGIALLPAVLSTGAGNSFLFKWVNRSTEGTVTAETLSIGWFGGVRMQNLLWQDASGDTQLQIASLKARPRWLALLAGRIALTDAVVEGPVFRMKKSPAVSSAGRQKSEPSPKSAPAPVYRIGPIELEIHHGQVLLEQARPDGQPPMQLHVKNLASTVVLNQPDKESAVSVSMEVGEGNQQGTIQARGQDLTFSSGAGLEGLSGQFDVEIRSLSLASLTPLLALAGKEVQMAGTLDGSAAVKIFNGQIQKLQLSADLAGFKQVYEGRTIHLEQTVKAQARISTQDSDWLIEQLEVEAPFCRLSGKGGLNAFEYTFTADLAQIQALTSAWADWKGYQAGGFLTAGGKVVRQKDSIDASGQLNIRECSLQQGERSFTFSELIQTYDLTLFPNTHSAQIRQAELSVQPLGSIRISKANVNWSQPDLQAELALSGTLDLKNAAPVAAFFYPLPADLSMAGMVRPEAKVQIQEGTLRVVTASTSAENLLLSKPGTEPFACQKAALKADILWDLKKNTLLELKDFDLDSDAVRIRGNLRQTGASETSQVIGQIQADYDWKEVSGLVRPFLPEALSLEGKRSDRFDFSVSKTPEGIDWKTLSANGSVGFQKAAYKGLQIGAAELKLTADKGAAAIDLADTPVNKGILRLAGDIDFTSTPPLFRLRKPMTVLEKVQLNDELTRSLLEYVNPLFAGASRVSGIADFSCEEFVLPLDPARKDLLKIKSVLAISQMSMRSDGFLKELLNVLGSDPSVILTLHPTPLTLEKEVLSYKDMQLDVGKNPLVFSGQIGLNRRIQLEMKMPWTLSGQSVRSGKDPADRIVLSVGGSIDKPQVDWGKVLQMNLGGILLKELLK
jgi:hypothetical protein